MRNCQFCDRPLDVGANDLPYRIGLGGFDPFYAAHDVCAEAARTMQRDRALHDLYCHLEDCGDRRRGLPPKVPDVDWTGGRGVPNIAPEPKPPNVGDR